MNAIKRFLGNKNTVTLIGVILGVLVLYMGYNWRVKQEIDPVHVPMTTQEIGSRAPITEDDWTLVQIPRSMVRSNLITDPRQLDGKFVSWGTTLPANSLFYQESIMTSDQMPNSAFANIKDGETVFPLDVTLQTTYGNSIFPGDYIDLYVRAMDDDGLLIFGRLIESIEVLAVKDVQGQHVFETTAENRIPSTLLFAVPDEMFLLLMRATFIPTNNIAILPIPRNASYTANPGETAVTSEYIRDFIEAKATLLPEENIEQTR